MKTVLTVYAYYAHHWQHVDPIGVMGTRIAVRHRAVVPAPYQAPEEEYPWLTIWVGPKHDAGGCCRTEGCEGHA